MILAGTHRNIIADLLFLMIASILSAYVTNYVNERLKQKETK
jgi:hypothetical protein